MASSYSQSITGLTAGTAYNFRVLATNAAGSGPVSSPAITATTAAIGAFTVSNGAMHDLSGAVFHPKGINVYQGDTTATTANVTRLFPHINFIRLACFDPLASAATLTPFVTAFTALKIVVYLEHHIGAGGGVAPLTGSALTAESAWFASLATAFKTNPYVWFGTINEPSGPGTDLSAEHLSNYNAIRNAGNNNPVIHSILGVFSGNTVPFYTVGAGQGLVSSTYAGMTNVCWDLHFYNFLSNDSTNFSFIQGVLVNLNTEAQTIQSKDGIMPVYQLEFGNSTNGTVIDVGGNVCVDVVCQTSAGFAAWNWSPQQAGNDPNSDALTDTSGNLTPFGTQVAGYIG